MSNELAPDETGGPTNLYAQLSHTLLPSSWCPLVLGHAPSMKAIHGGKGQHDRIDAHTIAELPRGGMLPQAYAYPAAMRATRDLLRRRTHLAHKRVSCWRTCRLPTASIILPAIGKNIAYMANRDGVAERFADPAVHKSIEVDLSFIDYYDHLLRDLEPPGQKSAIRISSGRSPKRLSYSCGRIPRARNSSSD